MGSAVDWYNANAEALAAKYESLEPEALHAWMADLLPRPPANVLDVGAGSGRDAGWLAAKGFEVLAVEPSLEMRRIAARLHPDLGIRWIADSLPGLDRTIRAGLSFDLILASAVWMHLHPSDRPRAFRKLVNLLNPGGLIAFSVRVRPSDPKRRMHPVDDQELESLARGHGAYVERIVRESDQLGRGEVRWMQSAVRLPDDSTGALPLLRHMILNDDKSSTYKLGLLRSLCRIADGTAGLAQRLDEETVRLPLGIVALTWVRLYKPLVELDCPQSPLNDKYTNRLGFAKRAFAQLRSVSAMDLRMGMRFSAERAMHVHQMLRDAVTTIQRMPAHYLTFQDGEPVFRVRRRSARRMSGPLLIDAKYLWSFGEMSVPWRIWQALQRYSIWIEPAVVEEWVRLMRNYAERQGRSVDRERIAPAMIWSDPDRVTSLSRLQAGRILNEGNLYCVWSGKSLSEGNLDLDHCLPWSAWPCSDLWNLMPARRTINRREKRAQLPSAKLMRTCQDRIMTWWDAAYSASGSGIRERFALEAESSLPGMQQSPPNLDTIFEAVLVQRARLQQNQRVPEWLGEKYVR